MIIIKNWNRMKIGFIGFGKMAKAIANGISLSKTGGELFFYDIQPDVRDFIHAITSCSSIKELEEKCDVIIFSVKPKDLRKVVEECKGSNEKYYISIAAGISLKKIREWNPELKNISRVMPNIGAFSMNSVSAIYSMNSLSFSITKSIFENIGIVIPLDSEDVMHVITGLSGSGPAFVYLFLQSMIEAGIREGLSYDISYLASLYTIKGAIDTLIEYNQKNKINSNPSDWIYKVASPGGTTIEGLQSLHKNKFPYCIYDAIHSATEKSKILGMKND